MNRTKLLALSDLGGFSDIVISKAIKISKNYKTPLDVLNIIEDGWFGFFKTKEANIEKISHAKLVNQAKSDADIFCKKGDFTDILLEHISNYNISALIIGFEKEKNLIDDFLGGSHLKKIINNAKIPVLVVKTSEDVVYDNILIPTDLSLDSRNNIEYLSKLFPNATFYIEHYYKVFFEERMKLYGFDDNEIHEYLNDYHKDTLEKMKEFISTLGAPSSIRIEYSVKKYIDFEILVEHSIKSNKIDLLSLSVGGIFSFTAYELLQSCSKDIILYKQ